MYVSARKSSQVLQATTRTLLIHPGPGFWTGLNHNNCLKHAGVHHGGNADGVIRLLLLRLRMRVQPSSGNVRRGTSTALLFLLFKTLKVLILVGMSDKIRTSTLPGAAATVPEPPTPVLIALTMCPPIASAVEPSQKGRCPESLLLSPHGQGVYYSQPPNIRPSSSPRRQNYTQQTICK